MSIRTGAGSSAAETRWQCEPMPGDVPDSTPHRWSLKKNKRGMLGTWIVNRNGASASFDTVSAAGQRDAPAATPR